MMRRLGVLLLGGLSAVPLTLGNMEPSSPSVARPNGSTALPAPSGPASAWQCATLGELSCPGVDELPRDSGCQVRCRGARCASGRLACARLRSRGCIRMNTNSAGTWSTLKAVFTNAAGVDALTLPWCAPRLATAGQAACTPDRPLCVAIAGSVSHDQYTARPITSMPAGVPIEIAQLGDYPRRRHAALVHLTKLYDS